MIPGYYDAAEARRGVAVGPFLLLATSPGDVIRAHQPALRRQKQGVIVDSSFWTTWIPLAQGGGGGSFGPLSLLTIWLPIGLLFWFLLIRPQQREKQRRQAMLGAVKKNDHVITAGGIYGVVTNVHREADEVTIKVDEAANVKLRVTLGSIAQVAPDQAAGNSSAS